MLLIPRKETSEIQVTQGITGNGQPSRLQAIEDTVDRLLQWRWWGVGAAAGSGAVISVLAWVVELAIRR
jgi:hypothetical protein